MNVIVVGNGPIAQGLSQEIDGFDVIIRMNKFQLYTQNKLAGTRTDIYSVWPSRSTQNFCASSLDCTSPSLKEIWFVRPISWCNALKEYHQFSKILPTVPRYHMPLATWRSILKDFQLSHLETMDGDLINTFMNSRTYTSQIGPSTGYSTVLMSLKRFKGSDIYIVGFSSSPSEGWYWGGNPDPSPRHPWGLERAFIQSMVAEGSLRLL